MRILYEKSKNTSPKMPWPNALRNCWLSIKTPLEFCRDILWWSFSLPTTWIDEYPTIAWKQLPLLSPSDGNNLKNKLLSISINFTPITSHSCLNKKVKKLCLPGMNGCFHPFQKHDTKPISLKFQVSYQLHCQNQFSC